MGSSVMEEADFYKAASCSWKHSSKSWITAAGTCGTNPDSKGEMELFELSRFRAPLLILLMSGPYSVIAVILQVLATLILGDKP